MKKKVVYWLFRAIRVEDNPALMYAVKKAERQNAMLEINFFVWPVFSSANVRNMSFLLHGVAEMAQKCEKLNIELHVIQQAPDVYFIENIQNQHILAIVSEQHVLKEVLQEQDKVRHACSIYHVSFDVVNTAVIVPVEEASLKQEYAAFTIRKKLHSKMNQHIKMLPEIEPLNQRVQLLFTHEDAKKIVHSALFEAVKESSMHPGEDAANVCLDEFIENRLANYHLRNEVDSNGQSYLSAYLHFGNISIKKVIQRVIDTKHENASLFIEEAFIRRELAENYCFYNKDYDSLSGGQPWAIETLLLHSNDEREYIYSLEDFENSNTHDDVWNYCQKQVVETGYLHSYLRMYWAKMVLYWTKHPQDAIDILIKLNDTYMLDGRDPNGYTGIMWSVAGVHDRPWFNKPITGLIRSMSQKGTLKKTKLKL